MAAKKARPASGSKAGAPAGVPPKEAIRAMRARLDDLERDLEESDDTNPCCGGFTRREVVVGSVRRMWAALTDSSSIWWRYMPDEVVTAAAANVELGDSAKASLRVSTEGLSDRDVALRTLEGKIFDREGLYDGTSSTAASFAHALAAAWLDTYWGSPGCPSFVFRLRIAKNFPNARLSSVSNAQILEMVSLWGERTGGRPPRGAKLHSKWERLAQFAKRLGIAANGEAIKKAISADEIQWLRSVGDYLIARSGPPSPEWEELKKLLRGQAISEEQKPGKE